MNDTAVQMGLTTKDIIQIVLWIITAFGVLVAAGKAIVELRLQRKQRVAEYQQLVAEYRWRQAELAKEILDAMGSDEGAVHAMFMLDWTNRPFDIAPNISEPIKHEDIDRALRIIDLKFDKKETFIRDCFDALFDGYQRLEHYINIGLLLFEDVKYPVSYYVEELSGKRYVIDKYLKEYDYEKAERFFNRFDFWRAGEDRSREPCVVVD